MAGRKIDDHANWIGGKGKNAVLPDGAHTKAFSSAEGAGAAGMYQDTTEFLKAQQEKGVRKAKARPMFPYDKH